jgi:prevent-host-death family protein
MATQLRDAKATLSKVIDDARRGEPSIITRHGRPAAVVLSFEEWQRLSRVPSFGRLLMEARSNRATCGSGTRDHCARRISERVYLVDTNVLSAGAPTKAKANPDLADWMDRNSECLFLSVVTIAEIEDGIAKTRREGASRRADRLDEWLKTVLHLHSARVLVLDVTVARLAGRLADHARGSGRYPELADLTIAATAQLCGYTVLTRNVRHFRVLGVTVHDPFESLPEATE